MVLTVIWGSLGAFFSWLMPYRMRYITIVLVWTQLVVYWLRITCGVRWRILGREHVPQSPCVVLARHESTWETLFLQRLFMPQATVAKKELLQIPFFGWAFALMRPISINRTQRKKALEHIIRIGRQRLDEGIWVLIFPEGSRQSPGQRAPLKRSGAALAVAAECPLLVVAHDAGRCWPKDSWLKYSGTITVEISPPIATRGVKVQDVTTQAQLWLKDAMTRLYPDFDPPESADNVASNRDRGRDSGAQQRKEEA